MQIEARHSRETAKTKQLKVLHVTPAYFPATYWGGPIYSVLSLCNALAAREDVVLRVATTNSAGPRANLSRFDLAGFRPPYPVRFFDRVCGATFAPGLLLSLVSAIRWADVVHLTGVFSSPTIPVLLLAHLWHRPVVWSPRGSLHVWEGVRRVFLKRIWLGVCRSVMGRDVIAHVTSAEEAKSVSVVFPQMPTIIVENAVHVPSTLQPRQWRPEGRLRLLFVGRLDPKKGLENLFSALHRLESTEVGLAIGGMGDPAYIESLRQRVRELGLQGRVNFLGYLDEPAKAKAFSEADLCVVPSFSENYCLVVAESLANSVPVIASTGTPWQSVNEVGCGLWVDNSPESLASAINDLAKRDLESMGRRGRDWLSTQPGWAEVAEKLATVYSSLCRRPAHGSQSTPTA